MEQLIENFASLQHWQKGAVLFAFYMVHFWGLAWLVWLLMRAWAERLVREVEAAEEYRIRKMVVEHLDDMLEEHTIFHPRHALTPAERAILGGERHRF